MHPSFIEGNDIIVSKSNDYGDPDHAKRSYFPFGNYSYAHMLHTKMERIKNVVKLLEEGKKPNNESLRDSVIDLMNYAAFYAQYLKEEQENGINNSNISKTIE